MIEYIPEYCGIDHFDKHFDKNTRKRGPTTKKNCILNGKFNPIMDTIRTFFSKIRTLFFRFSKKVGEASPVLPNCAPVSVVEYASTSLNMPENS